MFFPARQPLCEVPCERNQRAHNWPCGLHHPTYQVHLQFWKGREHPGQRKPFFSNWCCQVIFMDEIESLQKEVAELRSKVTLLGDIPKQLHLSHLSREKHPIWIWPPGCENDNRNRALGIFSGHWDCESSSRPWCRRWSAFTFLPLFTDKVSAIRLMNICNRLNW